MSYDHAAFALCAKREGVKSGGDTVDAKGVPRARRTEAHELHMFPDRFPEWQLPVRGRASRGSFPLSYPCPPRCPPAWYAGARGGGRACL